MKKIRILFMSALTLLACTQQPSNPFFTAYDTPHSIPPFDQIKTAHYLPAFREGIKQHVAEIEAIVSNTEAPTFENTLERLDYSGELLRKVSLVFFTLTSNETNDEMNEIAQTISPELSEHSDNMYLNAELFERIQSVYEQRATLGLNREQERLLEDYYKDFVRSGASLNEADQARMREINKELGLLNLKFSDNVLKETNNFKLIVENQDDLAGLPAASIEAAAVAAKEEGLDGKWMFTLHKPSWIPFMQYAQNRALREQMFRAYNVRADQDNDQDNKEVVRRIAALRLEKANLLGYPTHAAFVLEENMAKTPEAVMSFLDQIWVKGVAKAKQEVYDMQQIIDAEGGDFQLQAWDWWYYAEKLRQQRFDLDESVLRPYFSLEKVRQGAFDVAEKLYGIQFKKLEGMPVYHSEVEVFEVLNADGSQVGIFLTDYFPRPGKRAGAWMGNFGEQYRFEGKDVRPIVYNVGNFTRPTADAPSLLTLDEVETLFHEFGHGLHGLLTRCQYLSTSGTNVARDFVELPSQIMEHWAVHPEVLKMYAHHYQTGEVIPDELIQKIAQTSTFNQGFMTTELVAAAILDMKWHTQTATVDGDVRGFESDAMKEIGLIDEILPRYRSTFFNHIFSGGYSAGYYAYLWAEVLDSDAFKAFEEKGIFDPQTARLFRENVLERGNSEDPMTLYKAFRGAEPDPSALIERRGL